MENEQPLNAGGDETVKQFKKLCDKAVLFVTCKASNTVRIYFAPNAFEEATSAAPGSQEPEENEIYDAKIGKGAVYPSIFYEAQFEEPDPFRASFEEKKMHDTTEMFALRELEKEGKIAHMHTDGTFEDIMLNVNLFLKDRLHISERLLEDEKQFIDERVDHTAGDAEKGPLLTVSKEDLQLQSQGLLPKFVDSLNKRIKEGPATEDKGFHL